MRYTKTIVINSELELKGLQVGQWFKWHLGAKGQYLGQTLVGTYVCAYSHSGMSKQHAKRVGLQRKFALRYGAK